MPSGLTTRHFPKELEIELGNTKAMRGKGQPCGGEYATKFHSSDSGNHSSEVCWSNFEENGSRTAAGLEYSREYSSHTLVGEQNDTNQWMRVKGGIPSMQAKASSVPLADQRAQTAENTLRQFLLTFSPHAPSPLLYLVHVLPFSGSFPTRLLFCVRPFVWLTFQTHCWHLPA